MKIEYRIYKPSGNDTALVNGIDFNDKKKKNINDEIMKKHNNVEQVGFLNNDKYELQMAGGEFCGNATRSAVYSYLDGKEGNIHITVNKDKILEAGIDKNGKVWTEIPLYKASDWIDNTQKGIYIVKMEGMRTIVIKSDIAGEYLKNKRYLKNAGMKLIKEYELENNEAVGVMFCENLGEKIKINPIVWVKKADTLFYETACGSGTTAVGMVESYERKKDVKIDVIQPSGMEITISTKINNDIIEKAIIEGKVLPDSNKYFLNLEV